MELLAQWGPGTATLLTTGECSALCAFARAALRAPTLKGDQAGLWAAQEAAAGTTGGRDVAVVVAQACIALCHSRIRVCRQQRLQTSLQGALQGLSSGRPGATMPLSLPLICHLGMPLS